MNFFKKLISEDTGVSSLRFMSITSLFVGSSIAYITLFLGKDLANASPVIGIFIGAAFGGKVWHKYAEKKQEVKK